MTIRFLSGSALAAALLAAPAAPAQVMQTRPVQTRPVQSRPATQAPLPSGVVLRPGERLVSPAAPPQSSGVVTLGGVQPSGGRYVTQTSGTVPMTTRPMTSQPMTSQPMAARPMTTQPMATQTSMMSGGDQARAQAEANMMASRGIRGHVGGTIGAFEGVGWSAGGTPNTCTPGRPMRLTADAIARGPGGVYRVRAWR